MESFNCEECPFGSVPPPEVEVVEGPVISSTHSQAQGIGEAVQDGSNAFQTVFHETECLKQHVGNGEVVQAAELKRENRKLRKNLWLVKYWKDFYKSLLLKVSQDLSQIDGKMKDFCGRHGITVGPVERPAPGATMCDQVRASFDAIFEHFQTEVEMGGSGQAEMEFKCDGGGEEGRQGAFENLPNTGNCQVEMIDLTADDDDEAQVTTKEANVFNSDHDYGQTLTGNASSSVDQRVDMATGSAAVGGEGVSCSLCNAHFQATVELEGHLMGLHGVSIAECQICGLKFHQGIDQLLEHLENDHGKLGPGGNYANEAVIGHYNPPSVPNNVHDGALFWSGGVWNVNQMAPCFEESHHGNQGSSSTSEEEQVSIGYGSDLSVFSPPSDASSPIPSGGGGTSFNFSVAHGLDTDKSVVGDFAWCFCGSKFTTTFGLHQHVRQQTSPVTFRCNFCQKIYTKRVGISNHLLKCHGHVLQ